MYAHAPLVGWVRTHIYPFVIGKSKLKGKQQQKFRKVYDVFLLATGYFLTAVYVSLFYWRFSRFTLLYPVPFFHPKLDWLDLKGSLQHGNAKPVFLTVHDMGSNREFLLFVCLCQPLFTAWTRTLVNIQKGPPPRTCVTYRIIPFL